MEHFEKNIKEKIIQRKIQPSAQAWDKLEAMLNEQEVQVVKKKSPRTFLFIAASLLALVSLGTFFFKMNSTSVEPNKIETLPNESLVIEENRIQRAEAVSEENSNQNEIISEAEIIKTKSENKAVAHLPKVEKEVFKESNVHVKEEIILVEENKQIAELIPEVKQQISSPKADPKKLLMVAEYEKNVEKSASQFKHMKEKFQEVKTALHNINE